MAQYTITAGKANTQAKRLLEMIPEDQRPHAAVLIARVFNLGFRCNPRAAHHTIRLTATQIATRDLPVTVRMGLVKGDRGTFNALQLEPVGAAPNLLPDEETSEAA